MTLHFKQLKNNLTNIDHVISDYSLPYSRNNDLHNLHMAYNKYYEENKETPRSWSIVDFEIFKKYINITNENKDYILELGKKFCYTLRGDLLPFISIIAGIVSQEVLKAIGKKYIPIKQWLYIDYLELIDDNDIKTFENEEYNNNYKSKSKYEGIINIFGKELHNKIINKVPFIVGSGAIGCELVKNLGMLGVKKIILTDMDHIEKSNLSRQFLFSDNDIKKSKSRCASEKIKIFNPDTNIVFYENKVCKETENIFNEKFHEEIDIYMNALDNVDARLYMDQLAIKYEKPLTDSGTMGSKGNVQVIIPYLTESYGSTKDPEDNNSIPICTIKTFPYKQSHTIQWARELFENEFNTIPNLINKYKNNIALIDDTNTGDLELILKQIFKYKSVTSSYEGYYNILIQIYNENFVKSIDEIINKYEENKDLDVTGKNLPKRIEIYKEIFDEYMKYGYIILSQIFNTSICYNSIQRDIDIKVEELDVDKIGDIEKFKEIVKSIINNLPQIKCIEFEKDDDTLGHVDWITKCSNIRNLQYSIPLTDTYETRKIAGNIIPAMITTTSLIAGYQVLEYIKIIKYYNKDKYKNINFNSEINIFKNRFVNLNINYCDGITPDKCQTIFKNINFNLTLWDKIKVNTNVVTEIINKIQDKFMKKVEFITFGNITIYDGEKIYIEIINNFNSELLIILEESETPISIIY